MELLNAKGEVAGTNIRTARPISFRDLARAAWKGWLVTAVAVVGWFVFSDLSDNINYVRQQPEGALLLAIVALFHAGWIGLVGAAFAICWRVWGVWLLMPLGGAALGAILGAALVWLVFSLIDRGAMPGSGGGLHGGGHAAAIVISGVFGLAALIGACLGFMAGLVAAVIVVRRRRLRPAVRPRL
jgi:hypothetical protein